MPSNQAKGAIKLFKTQNPNDKTITCTWNKETQMTGQYEPLWKPEMKSGAPQAATVRMSPMSYQGMNILMTTWKWYQYNFLM